jgi:hypothetical protein
MSTLQRPNYLTPGLHLLIWGLLLALPAILLRGVSLNTGLPDHFFLLTNCYHISLFYFNAYFLYPRLLKSKTAGLYFLALGAIIAGSWFIKLFILKVTDPGFHLTNFNRRIIFFPPIPFLVASFIYRFLIDRIKREKERIEVAAERQRAELKILQSQVSPHFLFNVLTNLVSLARQKSDLLEPSLIKLSDLMRYMLYETAEEKSTVQKELEYLESYIDLMQLRFGDNLDLHFDNGISDTAKDSTIEPMLLLPFVENAFKHGIGLIEKPFIKIKISLNNEQLYFSVCNNYRSEHTAKDKNSGIGLVNVQNRLGILYPGKYALSIENKDEIYTVVLNLDLS